MITLKKILLPLDGSDCSRKAMLYALALAQQFGAKVVALHVAHRRWERPAEPTSFETGQDVVKKIQQQQAEEEQEILREVSEVGAKAGVTLESKIDSGSPPEVILRLAKEMDVDLIVMGTHGRSGISHALLGSVAEKTVQRAACPVLVVRKEEHEFVTP